MEAFFPEGSLQHVLIDVYHIWATDAVQSVLALVATALILFAIVRAARVVWLYIAPSKLPIYCHSESGSWAVVTGATDGIGRAFAEELLQRGFNVLLHGRNPDKLARVKKETSDRHPRRSVETVVVDASKYDDGFTAIVEKVKKLPGKVTVLVNNVGGVPTSRKYQTLEEAPRDDIDTVININVRFTTHLTGSMLPILRENAPSLILNVGSAGGIIEFPYIVAYGATKAYVHMFSRALKRELLAEGITNVGVLGALVGSVRTAGNPDDAPFTISAQRCAAGCLDRVGSAETLMWADWMQAIPTSILQMLPEKWIQKSLVQEMKKRRDLEKKGG